MTTTMQEVGSQLMKSPRELASWNFPLSKILEEYSELLPEAGKIHYGEVALIIQNSVNAYVRRLEALYDETRCFNVKLFRGQRNNGDISFFEEQREKKNLVNLTPFNLLEFKKETGKNVNLKLQNRKAVNFLHSCFSQLESSHIRLSVNLHDIQDELIGKKYDFRCNQQISKYGSLVDEFNLDDFDDDCILSKNFIEMDSENESRLDSTTYPSNANMLLLKSTPSSGFSVSNFDTSSSEIGGKNSNDGNINLPNFENDIGRGKNPVHLQPHDDFLSDVNNLQKESFEKADFDNKKVAMNNAGSLDFKSHIILRRSKKIKNKDNGNSDMIVNDTTKLQPISFTSGIPEKAEKSRTKFRFPCHRKLLTCNSTFKTKGYFKNKRKYTKTTNVAGDSNKTEYAIMIRKLPEMSNISGSSEDYSESSQQFHEESLCSKENYTVRYNPVATIKMDLAGFGQNNNKYVKFLEQPSYVSHINSILSPSDYASMLDVGNISPSASPPLDQCRSIESDTRSQVNIYQRNRSSMEIIIKEKIKAIYKELNLLTDEDQKIAKWHEEMKPKLIEAERKPPFFIHQYESRIVQKLENSNRRLDFNDIIREESSCEIARFFSATLQLASTNNLDINPSKEFYKGIELVLLD